MGHVIHKRVRGRVFAYGPYVREMNVWAKYVDELAILAPFQEHEEADPIDIAFEHPNILSHPVSSFDTLSFAGKMNAAASLPGILLSTLKAMRNADHIHLRCPGNMGLIGSIAQIFFPDKIKTAKYAGNWDKSSYRPKSYQIQQSILGNTSLSKNMSVLVYGEWPGESKNIKPFFTATYSNHERIDIQPRAIDSSQEIRLVFVGTLDSGKQPNLSIEVCHRLREEGINAKLDLFGEGELRDNLKNLISESDMKDHIFLHGNRPSNEIKEAFQKSHFLIFISKSEGWPKAVAEAMFWACVPITTKVSCVPQMLGNGERGELVEDKVEEVVKAVIGHIQDPEKYLNKAQKAMLWSREFTLEKFESEIKKMIVRAA